MKTLRILICGLLMMVGFDCFAQGLLVTNAGWFPISYYDSLVTNDPTEYSGAIQFAGNMSPTTPPVIAEAITPDIQALADGLADDPNRIFNYVHDHIKFVLYFGSKKGAETTLLEKSGNDFDQCALLVAMLRAAGYTNAGYQFGWMAIPFDNTNGSDMDLHHWLGLNFSNSNWSATAAYLQTLFTQWRNYPVNAINLGTAYGNNVMALQRVWVTLPIPPGAFGTNFTTNYLDPAFKVSEPIRGVSLQSVFNNYNVTNILRPPNNAMAYILYQFAEGTDVGNVSTNFYATNLNEPYLDDCLTNYENHFLGNLGGAPPNASMAQVLGGQTIVPSTGQSFYFPIINMDGTMPPINWVNEPTNLMSTLQITFGGQTYQWYFPQLQGQRISLVYGSSTVQLWQDDSNIANGSFSGSDSVTLTAHHPYNGNWDTNNNVYIPNAGYTFSHATSYYPNSDYAILYSFEPDWDWLQERQNKLDAYRAQGLANNSRQVTTETLNIMGLNWELQAYHIEQMLGQEIGVLPMWYQKVGRMAQESGRGYYVDVYLATHGSGNNVGQACYAGCDANADEWQSLAANFASALEHGMIEQLQSSNLVGASTVKMLEIANTNNQAIYLATAANWPIVQTKLSGYTISDLTSLINKGNDLLLPQNGQIAMGSGSSAWKGFGFMAWATNATGIAMEVGPGIYGGYAGNLGATINPDFVDYAAYSQPVYFSSAPAPLPLITAADPVDMVDGTFQVESEDLSLGQTEPRGINFSRYYNTTRRYSNLAGIGPGWLHSYYINAATVSSPEACLGGTTPAQAAAMVTATIGAIEVYNYNGGSPDPENWTVTALIAKWAVDQMKATAASVSLGQNTLQFIKQADGSFTPPADCTMTLSQVNTNYVLQERNGRTYQFNRAGWVTNIFDPYGQSLSVTYNSSNWVKTITDWTNRTMTFTYSASNLQSVADSSGRSISYGYDGAGNLTSFTDPEHKTSSFAYDTNHDIIATFNADGQVVASNIYNGFGKVTRQYTEGQSSKMWQIFWSGWQTIQTDPAGGLTTYSYDDLSREIGLHDADGYFSQKFYDGQDHVVKTVSPLNETNQFVFDGNNNLIETIDPLNYTNQLFYDGNNNLIQTIDARGDTNTFGYNSESSLTGQTNGAGDWVNYVYNADGTLHTVSDSGGTTTYGYDSYGQMNSITYPNGLGSESFVNDQLGDVKSHTDGNNNVTSFGYNNRRQLTTTTAPGSIFSQITYDDAGNPATVTDPRNNTTTSVWSPTRHVLTTTMPATPQGTPVLTNSYDSRDWLTATIDPLTNQTLYLNDADERVVLTTDPLERQFTCGYDGNGRETYFYYIDPGFAAAENYNIWDSRGKLTEFIGAQETTLTSVYDGAGNQIILTNRNGNPWHFYFDGANRLTNVVSPLQRSASVAFNHQGLPAALVDPMRQITANNYDAKGRLTNRADQVASTFYGYDTNDNLLSVSENGLTNTWTYDAHNRVSTYTDVNGYLLQYRYDAGGNLTNLIYPGNKPVYYAYDSLNRLTNVTDWSKRSTSYTYDLDGQLTNTVRPNGTYRTMAYDAAGELTNTLEQMANSLPIALFRYGWNFDSTMQWEFMAPLPHTNLPPTRTMHYDADNEVTNVDGNPVVMDNDGNLLNGPLTNDTAFAYTYDARNRLQNVGGVTNYYDAANNRVGQVYGTNSVVYVINSNAKLPQVLMRIKNGATTYYVYGLGLLYQITETPTGTNTLTYHYDYRGSTIALSGDNGIVTDRMEYSLYGTMTYRAGVMNDTPFLFNGKFGVMSDPNGLLYMQSRYYSPFLCRFLNPDPSGFSGGLNLYAYANGNPVSYIDPLGLGAVTDNYFTPSWTEAPTAGQIQAQQFLSALVNLATLGTANLISSATTGQDLTGNYETTSDAFEQSLQTAAFVGAVATSLPTDGATLEADAAFGGLGDIAAEDLAADSAVTAYRVEGLPNTRMIIGEGGQVSVQGDQMLFINFGEKARAEQFLATRLQQGMPGVQMKSFQVPQSFLTDLQEAAVPESMARQFPNNPLLVDPTKAPNQFGLRSDQIQALQGAIIEGTGKVH